ncbi:hypothetical protein RHIZ404_200215 [Rhizobium sp. EC-SD404]|nr:hypothetical protein RHIZ404_200215 [Rhizobium sp. EC-SD404]
MQNGKRACEIGSVDGLGVRARQGEGAGQGFTEERMVVDNQITWHQDPLDRLRPFVTYNFSVLYFDVHAAITLPKLFGIPDMESGQDGMRCI